jgi:hypothetical protein
MIEIVLLFAGITALGELLILYHMSPRLRAWVIGSTTLRTLFHFGFAMLNLWIHWGTVTGSMTAVTAFVVSAGVFKLADVIWMRRAA